MQSAQVAICIKALTYQVNVIDALFALSLGLVRKWSQALAQQQYISARVMTITRGSS